MKKNPKYNLVKLTYIQKDEILKLAHDLNPTIEDEVIVKRFEDMFNLSNYLCFGLYYNNELLGITSAWISTRFYCGKQLEIDNFIIDEKYRSKGYGRIFIALLTEWAQKNEFEAIELNTYVSNSLSQKFYYNQGFKITGFHFQKKINQLEY